MTEQAIITTGLADGMSEWLSTSAIGVMAESYPAVVTRQEALCLN